MIWNLFWMFGPIVFFVAGLMVMAHFSLKLLDEQPVEA